MPLRVSAVGDISLGDHPVCVGHGMRHAFYKHRASVLSEARNIIKSSDIAIGNLETVTSDVSYNRKLLPSHEMRGDPEALNTLKDTGFGVLGVANNHAMQHGAEAFYDTLKNIKDRGISAIGYDNDSGETVIHKVEFEGKTSFIFAVSLRPEEWHTGHPPYSYRENVEALIAEVKKMRAECEGFLICSIHWGLEFLTSPGPKQVRVGRALVDAGVDVVLGHHPHVLQPIEEYKNGIIFYSLGNFTFDLWSELTKLTGVVQLELEFGKKPKFVFFPFVISDDFRLREPSKSEEKKINELLRVAPNKLDAISSGDEKAYGDRYRIARKQFRYSSYRYFAKNIYKYPLHFLVQSLGRTFLRRLTGN